MCRPLFSMAMEAYLSPRTIKRMKQLEQEKDILVQGLEAVDRARDWYLTQIRAVQEKQKYIGKSSSPHDYSVEAHQERMNFQQTRIFEVNQQLKALVDSSEKGFPLHMNLALSQPLPKQRPENTETSNIVAMLKGQNRLLTQEVSQKSDKISQLEREKATLIRDMFESRSKNRNANYDDTTFM